MLNIVAYCRKDKNIVLHECDDKIGVIVLIHGSGSNNKEWFVPKKLIKKYLSNYIIYAINLHDYYRPGSMPDKSITEFTDVARQQLKDIYERHDMSITLIGHSMGGLVSLELLDRIQIVEDVDNDKVIKNIITISSPIKGAPLLTKTFFSKILNTFRHQEMTPKSEYLINLHNIVRSSKLNTNPNRILTIGSTKDIHVPNDYASLENINSDHMVVEYGHGSIVDNHEIWINISQWLANKFE